MSGENYAEELCHNINLPGLIHKTETFNMKGKASKGRHYGIIITKAILLFNYTAQHC